MKIRLKALRLPFTSGTYYEPTDRNDSGTGWKTVGETHSEIYWQESDGRIAGEMLGIERWIWIPYRVITTTPQRDGYYVIDSVTYKILDIKKEIYSEFENHYNMFISQKIT